MASLCVDIGINFTVTAIALFAITNTSQSSLMGNWSLDIWNGSSPSCYSFVFVATFVANICGAETNAEGTDKGCDKGGFGKWERPNPKREVTPWHQCNPQKGFTDARSPRTVKGCQRY